MEDLKKPCICFKFCSKLEKSSAETHEITHKKIGNHAMRRAYLSSRFKCGETSVEDCNHPGRPFAGGSHEKLENGGKILNEEHGYHFGDG